MGVGRGRRVPRPGGWPSRPRPDGCRGGSHGPRPAGTPAGPTRCGSAPPGPSGIGTARPRRMACPPVVARGGPTSRPRTATGGGPSSPTSSAAPSAMPPFGTAIPDALTGPTPGGHPPVPVAAVAVPDNARAPWRSRLTRRLDVRRASRGHPHPRIHARSSGPPYRPSDATPRGRPPRSLAVRIMAATAGVRGEPVGRLVPPRVVAGEGAAPSVPTGDTRAMPRTTPRRLPDPRRGAGSMGRADGSSGAESSVTTAPDRRRTCGPASVRSVAGSGSRRAGRRGTASSAGGPGPSGGTRAASGPERTFGAAVRTAMESPAGTFGALRPRGRTPSRRGQTTPHDRLRNTYC